jgi:hypothetical protein
VFCSALVLACTAGLVASAVAAAARLEAGRFSAGSLEGWVAKRFKGETVYTLRDGALCAESRAAGSGMYRALPIDLSATPVLQWSWRLGRLSAAGDERSKPGDDYAARVYVVFSGGAFFWRTRAINYVWSANQPVGASWPNVFTGNARMLAVRSGSARAGEWLHEQRDVRADFRALFGEDIERADAVAIMTDTDNGGGEAAACYGDITFTAHRDDRAQGAPPRGALSDKGS